MDPAERLADYLAGQLDPDEQAALEAELARDPALRADLDAMRAADDHLAVIPPATPRAGFEERLIAALSEPVAAALGGTSGATVATGATVDREPDELAARRADRTTDRGLPRWVTAVSGAAAALVVLAGAGIVFSNVLGGQDSADEAIFETQSLDGIEEDAFDEDTEMTDDAAVADGPLLLGGDRSIDDQDIQTLLEDPEAFGIVDRGLDGAAGRDIAGPFAQALGAAPPDAAMERPEADDGDAAIAEDAPDAAEESDEAEAPPGPGVGAVEPRIDTDVSAEDRAQIGTCLQLLLSETPDVIPTYAELIVFEGVDAIVFGLISEDPETGLFTRREAWIVDRDSCEVRLFTQQ